MAWPARPPAWRPAGDGYAAVYALGAIGALTGAALDRGRQRVGRAMRIFAGLRLLR